MWVTRKTQFAIYVRVYSRKGSGMKMINDNWNWQCGRLQLNLVFPCRFCFTIKKNETMNCEIKKETGNRIFFFSSFFGSRILAGGCYETQTKNGGDSCRRASFDVVAKFCIVELGYEAQSRRRNYCQAKPWTGHVLLLLFCFIYFFYNSNYDKYNMITCEWHIWRIIYNYK